MTGQPTVFVVDDDQSVRDAVCALLRSMGLAAQAFASAEEFLDRYVPDTPGCIVTDVRMPGMSGIELQERLGQRGISLPVIIQTAFAHTRLTVRAMEAGAITVLEKPYRDDELWDAVRKALKTDAAHRVQAEKKREIQQRLQLLSPGEREVLGMIVEGESNKAIAVKLEVSVRAIEARRSSIYKKMQADSVAELVRMVLEAQEDGKPA
jgi:two-component system, LuxR family, response regulator FixJ